MIKRKHYKFPERTSYLAKKNNQIDIFLPVILEAGRYCNTEDREKRLTTNNSMPTYVIMHLVG